MSRSKRGNDFPDNGFEMWGGYMNAKIAKLEEQFLDQAAKEAESVSSIFSGISIFVNGYTTPTANELKVMMAEHGGIYHHYFKSDKTKFIIASNLPDTKVKNLPTTKIVKPEWISESIAAGTLLDYKDYLLYCNHSKTQPRLNFRNVPSESTGNKTDDSILPSTSNQDRNITDELEVSKTVSIPKVSPNQQNSKSKYAATAVDPTFLSEFYNNSRLHHISQLGAGFKQYVNDLRDKSDFNFPKRDAVRKPSNLLLDSSVSGNDKTIMHIDMDCFFVSVGLRKYPHLRGRPVAVTHSKGGAPRQKRDGVDRFTEFNMYKERKRNQVEKVIGKRFGADYDWENNAVKSRVDDLSDEDGSFGSMSEIASCSYEARNCGIHNGMFMGPALRLCPDLKTIPYDFEAYKEVAFLLYDTVAEYTLDIEAVSCDEMYVDCTELLRDIGLSAMEFATILRKQIKDKTGCPCSTGFGANRLQARMATKKAKPDGQYHLPKEDVEVYFSSVALADLPGVGHQMQNKLTALGYTDCASLRTATLPILQKHFGNKTGLLLYNCCRGADDKPLQYTTIRKSISAGVNYGIRFEDSSQAETFLKQLCQEVCSRMSQSNVVGKMITLKLMVRSEDAPVETAKFMGHGFCDNITKATNLSHCTRDVDIITKEVLELCKKITTKPEDMRGISIQISKLEGASKNDKNNKGRIQDFLKKQTNLIPPNKSEIKNMQVNLLSSESDNSCDLQGPSSKSSGNETLGNSVSTVVNENVTNPTRNDQNIEQIGATNNFSHNRQPVMSVKQTSPLKRNKSLGLTGRRRGRPPKHLSLPNNSSVKGEKNKTINMFLNAVPNATTSRGTDDQAMVDEEFLNALPDDIKSEILANYKIKSKQPPYKQQVTRTPDIISNTEPAKIMQNKKQPISNLRIDPEYLSALPEDLRKEIESNIEMYSAMSYIDNTSKIKEKCDNSVVHPQQNHEVGKSDNQDRKISDDKNVPNDEHVNTSDVSKAPQDEETSNSLDVMQLHWKEMRSLLRSWFISIEEPLPCDVDVITLYLQSLVHKRKIEDVYCLMNFMHRILSDEHSCQWHKAYREIEGGLQQAMLDVYENKLQTNTMFSCCDTKE